MRLFIAVNFNTDTRSRLLALCDELRSRSERGRFTVPENLHLTLAFLGECDVSQATLAKNAMTALLFEPFDVRIDRVGRFKRYGGDIWWAGVCENKALLELQRDLADKLTYAGFNIDKRKYSPHITLGREIVTKTVPWEVEPFGETVSSIELMKSERIGGKLTYTAISKKHAAD